LGVSGGASKEKRSEAALPMRKRGSGLARPNAAKTKNERGKKGCGKGPRGRKITGRGGKGVYNDRARLTFPKTENVPGGVRKKLTRGKEAVGKKPQGKGWVGEEFPA